MLTFPSFAVRQMSYSWPVKKTPRFKTIIQTPASGRGEVRIPLMLFPLWDFQYDLSYIIGDATQSNSAWQVFVNFFMAVQGGGSDWLFEDPYDNSVTGQAIGTTSGSSSQVLTMYRTLVTPGGAMDLVQNFQGTPTVKVGETALTSGQFAIDQYGNLTWAGGYSPSTGQAVTWTGGFYFRCHFEADSLEGLEEQLLQVWQCQEVKFSSHLL